LFLELRKVTPPLISIVGVKKEDISQKLNLLCKACRKFVYSKVQDTVEEIKSSSSLISLKEGNLMSWIKLFSNARSHKGSVSKIRTKLERE